VVKDAKLRLHNRPSDFLEFAAGSSATLGDTTVAIPIPEQSFSKLGGRYAYYLNDMNSTAISIAAVPGAVRVTLAFESDGPELVGRCLAGACIPDQSLPHIEWLRPRASIDLVPVALGDSISLKIKKVELGGTPEASCRTSAGFIGGVCQFIVTTAKASMARTFAALGDSIRDKFNTSAFPQQVATGLKKHLVLGPAGEVRVRTVAVGTQSVVVSFCLRC
jgi:hypothetical protein